MRKTSGRGLKAGIETKNATKVLLHANTYPQGRYRGMYARARKDEMPPWMNMQILERPYVLLECNSCGGLDAWPDTEAEGHRWCKVCGGTLKEVGCAPWPVLYKKYGSKVKIHS